MADYTSSWEGVIKDGKTFNLQVAITGLSTEVGIFRISNENNAREYAFPISEAPVLHISLSEGLTFKGIISDDHAEINGFIKSGILLYHIRLTKTEPDTYKGSWNILMVDQLESEKLYLSVENGKGDTYEAYPFFGDTRFTGTWCTNFQKEGDQITFMDFKTGLQFRGKLVANEILLGVYIGELQLTEVLLQESTRDWQRGGIVSENTPTKLRFPKMEALIASDSLTNTHSVVISKKGEVLYERYFNGYNAKIPHDTRSASKSIGSAVVGIAKDRALFKNLQQSNFEFLPKKYQQTKDPSMQDITLESLLTMSSGLDAIDYGKGANPDSPAVENSYQSSPDWTASVLDAHMIHPPNTVANYGSANPYLLGVAMDSLVSEPLELFMDTQLFQPLGITNYIIQTDLKGRPYFGGGMYFTPRDLLTFGELYLKKGNWNNKQVISEAWVSASLKNYRPLQNVPEQNGYGYLWWHHSYTAQGKEIATYEARGAGGQYIFVVPALEVVAVITSGDYRNGKTQQPELIFERYILPKLME